jgi:hypothetical protein
MKISKQRIGTVLKQGDSGGVVRRTVPADQPPRIFEQLKNEENIPHGDIKGILKNY